MARIRTIKPEYWEDEKVSQLTFMARLLFIGMWNFADDLGVIKGNPAYIKSRIFPYDEIPIDDIKNCLAEIEKLGMIIKFTNESENLIYIRKFTEHQLINRPSKTTNIDEETLNKILSLNTHGVISEGSVMEGKGKGNRKGMEVSDECLSDEKINFSSVIYEKDKDLFIEQMLSSPESWYISIIRSLKNQNINTDIKQLKETIPKFCDHVSSKEKWGLGYKSLREYWVDWLKYFLKTQTIPEKPKSEKF